MTSHFTSVVQNSLVCWKSFDTKYDPPTPVFPRIVQRFIWLVVLVLFLYAKKLSGEMYNTVLQYHKFLCINKSCSKHCLKFSPSPLHVSKRSWLRDCVQGRQISVTHSSLQLNWSERGIWEEKIIRRSHIRFMSKTENSIHMDLR